MAKTVTQRIMEMSHEELARLQSKENRAELESLYRGLRIIYGQRMAQFRKYGVKSYAAELYENIRPGKEGEKAVKREIPSIASMSSPRLYGEIAALKKFLESESSTVTGIERINRAQDARIFGVGPNGEPLGRLSQTERDFLWDEFERISSQLKIPTSNQRQIAIADIIIQAREVGITALEALTEETRTKLYKERIEEREMEFEANEQLGNSIYSQLRFS